MPLREELEKPFAARVFLWPRQGGPKGDLVDDEMGRVLQVPPERQRVVVEGVNRIKKHTKVGQTARGAKTGGIVTTSDFLSICALMRTNSPGHSRESWFGKRAFIRIVLVA